MTNVPTVKITLGTPFPGVPAGIDPWAYSIHNARRVEQSVNAMTAAVISQKDDLDRWRSFDVLSSDLR